ncbi:hypothetical protein BDV59DRAFT_178133 [Aspergillus ambiguus]|uniref:uncharacterized protein n=1 Tax=Aspergillus ambiguus TaxID=176160 RepID=UPI003CCD1ECD
MTVAYEQGMPFGSRPPLLGHLLTTPGGARKGLQVQFYAGHEFQEPGVATSYWDDSHVADRYPLLLHVGPRDDPDTWSVHVECSQHGRLPRELQRGSHHAPWTWRRDGHTVC